MGYASAARPELVETDAPWPDSRLVGDTQIGESPAC
jgi:hypothetical protein